MRCTTLRDADWFPRPDTGSPSPRPGGRGCLRFDVREPAFVLNRVCDAGRGRRVPGSPERESRAASKCVYGPPDEHPSSCGSARNWYPGAATTAPGFGRQHYHFHFGTSTESETR